jgi:hypothetical protein
MHIQYHVIIIVKAFAHLRIYFTVQLDYNSKFRNDYTCRYSAYIIPVDMGRKMSRCMCLGAGVRLGLGWGGVGGGG